MRREFDEGETRVGAAPEHAPCGARRQAERVGPHPPAARGVEPPQRQVDLAFLALRRALDDGPIGLADASRFEQLAEPLQRLAMAPKRQAAGRVLIEPMRQRRRTRQAESQLIECVLEARPALRAAMHGDARGLVDDQHQPVAMQQAREKIRRRRDIFIHAAFIAGARNLFAFLLETGRMTISSPTPKLRVAINFGVARLSIDNAAKRNAFDFEMWRALPPLMQAVEAEPEARVLVISGAPGLPFCSGADISEFSTVRATSEGGRAYEEANVEAFHAISCLTKPTIAAIAGFCLGGGMGLAAACDLRVAQQGAVFAIPAARLGVGYPPAAMRYVVAAVGRNWRSTCFSPPGASRRRRRATSALSRGFSTRKVLSAPCMSSPRRSRAMRR